MNHKVNPTIRKEGFTLIELLLAMTFISILLLTIAMTIIQIANIYNRGTILKEINQTSRSLSQELDSAMRTSGTFSLDPTAKRYVNNAWGGRLCMGQYSYIWNYGKTLATVDPNRNQYSGPNDSGIVVNNSDGTKRYDIGFVKVPDSGAADCVPDGQGKYPAVSPVNAVELLRSGDHSLVLHAFNVVSSATSVDPLSAQQLYKISFTLGTNDLNALNSDQTACKAPNVAGSDLNYCSIQQFTIVLRVVSGVN